MNDLIKWVQKAAGNKWVQHGFFWLLSFRVLLEIFSSSSEIMKIDYLYTLVFSITIIIPVYLNLQLALPVFFNRRKYLFYFLSVMGLIAFFSLFNQFAFNHLVDLIFPGYYFISYYELTDIARFLFVFMGLTTLLKLSGSWFALMEAREKIISEQKLRIENELSALKAQVNPHFMFNSLNNIYSLSLKDSARTPEAILKLGDILRYVIYEARDNLVPLEKEIKLIRDYIDLQRLRVRRADISFDYPEEVGEVEIVPLLFLPLVENAFKHGIKAEAGEGFLHVKLSVSGKELSFSCMNNKPSEVKKKEEEGGTGIENVRRRLELTYPGKHGFFIEEKGKSFNIVLNLKLQ